MFGDAPSVKEIRRGNKIGVGHVTGAWFWYPFRESLTYTAPILFVLTYALTFFFVNKLDGFLFFGSILSCIGSVLVVLSYWHIKPWRKHPSPLMFQISVTSLVFTVILLINSFPIDGIDNISDSSSAVNIVGSSSYSDEDDGTIRCKVMSFFMQLSLLSRELWTLTFSLDLVTSITNPFASYTKNLRRYHLCIWFAGILSAAVLVNQPSCQGEFLTNGTCWLKFDGVDSLCFWFYYLGWACIVYVKSISVIAFAYFRISKGLEATYATRFACVSATFRVVLFYFFYSCILVAFFFGLSAAVRDHLLSDRYLKMFEHLFSYLLACRGFFDSLVWFFSHGFTADDPTDYNSSISRLFDENNITSLSMKEVLSVGFGFRVVVRWFTTVFTFPFWCIRHVSGRDNSDSIRAGTSKGSTAANSNLMSAVEPLLDEERKVDEEFGRSSSARNSSATSAKLSNLRFDQLSKNYEKKSLEDVMRLSDIDLSPQLNLALRSELLLLVTHGIKQSVQRQYYLHDKDLVDVSPTRSASEGPPQSPSSSHGLSGSLNSTSLKGSKHYHPSNSDYSLNNGFISSTVAGLIGAITGVHLPGEYGVDPIVSSINTDFGSSYRYNANNSHNNSARDSIRNSEYMRPSFWSQRSSAIAAPTIHGVPTGDSRPKFANNVVYQSASSPKEQPVVLDASMDATSSQNSESNKEGEEKLLSHPSHQEVLHSVLTPPPREVVFNIDAKRQFRDYRPATFKKLREIGGFSDDKYLELVSLPTRERLADGGSSGAFFFYCGNGMLIVKTVAKHEAKTLLEILDKYLQHLIKNPASLIVRFFGLHTITMYGNEFTFVVMKNIFPAGVHMNEKYDIKGSYVNRNAKRIIPGKRSLCRHCNTYFIEGSSDSRCSEVVGSHEASITLKDNDMINKIRLFPDDAFEVIETLMSDSDALCDMGIMDYSLLVGITNMHFNIEDMRQSIDRTMSNNALAAVENSNRLIDENAVTNTQLPSILSKGKVAFQPTPSEVAESYCSDRSMTGYPARTVIAPNTYYFGMIDTLQTWSFQKKLEYFFKVYILRMPADGVSCMAPEEYKIRFQARITRIVEHSLFIREITGSWSGRR